MSKKRLSYYGGPVSLKNDMKYYTGHGTYLEPDEPPRDTPYHMRIVKVQPILNTRCGNWLDLECGHRVMAFGDLKHAAGRVRCTECRDRAENTI